MTKLGFSPHVSHLSSPISLIGLILLFPYISNVEGNPFSFESITTGNTSPYNHINENNPATWKNDLSGAAHIGNVNLVVDDLLSSVRIWRDGTSESTSITIPYHRLHRDVEGATQIDNYLIVSCSMTHLTDDSFNLLTRYQISTGNPITMTNGQSVVMRSQIMTAINNTLGQADRAWFTRIQTFGEKDGNLNVEGISATAPNSPYELVWGVRSPLFHPEFATFQGTQQVLNQGDAIVVFVKNAFTGIPQFQVETINLQGKGIRSIEYVPSLHGYLIVSGPVPKADSYRLWLWRPTKNENNDPILIDITDRLPQFVQLGRPEAIMLRTNKLITIFSEEDPTFTINPPFNYIDAEIKPGSDN